MGSTMTSGCSSLFYRCSWLPENWQTSEPDSRTPVDASTLTPPNNLLSNKELYNLSPPIRKDTLTLSMPTRAKQAIGGAVFNMFMGSLQQSRVHLMNYLPQRGKHDARRSDIGAAYQRTCNPSEEHLCTEDMHKTCRETSFCTAENTSKLPFHAAVPYRRPDIFCFPHQQLLWQLPDVPIITPESSQFLISFSEFLFHVQFSEVFIWTQKYETCDEPPSLFAAWQASQLLLFLLQ